MTATENHPDKAQPAGTAPEEVKRKKVARLSITAEFVVNESIDAAEITALAKDTVEALRGIGEVTSFKLTLPAHEVKL